MAKTFEQYVREGEAWDLTGWDFEPFKQRWVEHTTSWSYKSLVEAAMVNSISLLDMGTGGGEFLSSLKNLPNHVCATEGYEPNVEVARKRLLPLGVKVAFIQKDSHLPFSNKTFDLVINRHESFDAKEIFRILKPGGVFITQQVGGKDNQRVNQLLEAPANEYADWSLNTAMRELTNVGFVLSETLEEYPETQFTDIGALIVFLRSIPWQIRDFSANKYLSALKNIHESVFSQGKDLTVHSHRFFIRATKPKA